MRAAEGDVSLTTRDWTESAFSVASFLGEIGLITWKLQRAINLIEGYSIMTSRFEDYFKEILDAANIDSIVFEIYKKTVGRRYCRRQRTRVVGEIA